MRGGFRPSLVEAIELIGCSVTDMLREELSIAWRSCRQLEGDIRGRLIAAAFGSFLAGSRSAFVPDLMRRRARYTAPSDVDMIDLRALRRLHGHSPNV